MSREMEDRLIRESRKDEYEYKSKTGRYEEFKYKHPIPKTLTDKFVYLVFKIFGNE